MKAYQDRRAVLIVGGRARDFFGEYLAGGELVVLGLGSPPGDVLGSYVGTGMHGGTIYVRGVVTERQVGREVGITQPGPRDLDRIRELVGDYCAVMDLDPAEVVARPFLKLCPRSHRPYGKLEGRSRTDTAARPSQDRPTRGRVGLRKPLYTRPTTCCHVWPRACIAGLVPALVWISPKTAYGRSTI
jgi:glutamate synthase domain-containing protein 3